MVHQYKNNGYDIVLDVNSGAIHVVDDVTYDVIEMYAARENVADTSAEEIVTALSGKYGKEEVEEAIDEVQTLIKNEELFTKDTYENYMMDFKKRPTVVKALCLHIAHDCNLACRYCFAEEGEYHGRRALMSFETGKKALDFLIANSGNRRNLEVDFFGGEPLMNWQVVKDLVAYGREQEKIHNKNFRFTLTTNGVLLNDEIMEFANKEMGNVVLSIDGRKEVHDHMRPFRKGAGSYDLIVPKFQKFAESRNQDKYYVRGTFTHNNLDFSNDVLHLADLGFKHKELGKQLKKIGMLIVQDQVWNRVTINRGIKSTRYYIDEFHLLLKEEQTAAYSVEIWKRFRKWGGVPTGITQNIKDLLASREIENIFENSDFILMLNQAAGDRQILAKQLNISPYQLSYVTNSGEGEGLLFYGTTIIPFKDKFDKTLKLYGLMTTKPEETLKRDKEMRDANEGNR